MEVASPPCKPKGQRTRNETKQANNGPKHQIPKSGNYPTGHLNNSHSNSGHPNNGGQKIKPPPKKKTMMIMNQDKNNVVEVENKGGNCNN